jgi:hypothetical protein
MVAVNSVNNLADLMKCFEPTVRKLLEDTPAHEWPMSVSYIAPLSSAPGHLLRFAIKMPESKAITAAHLCDVLHTLDGTYCMVEESESIEYVNGRRYMLGDGDDALAVFVQNGEINIWLRTWD